MATANIVLRKIKLSDNTYPLAIRITKDRKSSFVHIGKSIELKHWDEEAQKVRKSHPNSNRLNNLLYKKLAEANDKLLTIETDKPETGLQTIRANIKTGKGSSFNLLADEYLAGLKNRGKFNIHSADAPRINRFKEFLNHSDIAFNDITVPLLLKFQAYLRGTRKISERTVVNHLVAIRSIYSLALKTGVADKRHYPFGKEKIKIKFPESVKIGLSQDEVIKLENLVLVDKPRLHHARNIWLFSFYLAGMRVSDVLGLRWKDFVNGRLHYTMGKNDKSGSFVMPEKALRILDEYREITGKSIFVFPEMQGAEDIQDDFSFQRRVTQRTKWIDKKLKDVQEMMELDKKLTMHIARHTFGNLSGDKIPIQMLQKLYRHSSITTTIGYQSNFIYKDTDEALNAVIGF